MTLPRRAVLHLVAASAALPAAARMTWAQAYPARPVRMIVPFPAGQASDTVARLVGQSLSERLGQPFVIENRTGAGGNIGTESVVRAIGDGYTLLLASLSNAVNATLYKKLNFEFIRDIAPVASIGGGPYLMVVNPSVPAKTVAEFIAHAKANSGKINMGSSGSGSVSHVFGELFKMMTGVNLVHVPYRGGYVPDLLSGQVQVVFSTISSSIQYVRSGYSDAGGIRARLRGEPMVWCRRTERDTRRGARDAQQSGQRRCGRSEHKGAACRRRRRSDADDIRRVRRIHRRGNREVGQGDPRREPRGGMTPVRERGDPARGYSITSSARASSVGGTVMPSSLAVCKLRTSSNFVGCMTGRLAGFSPFRIWPV